MKRKIFLFLSIFVMALFLTGCSYTATNEELQKTKEIAYNTVNTPGYQFPEGYKVNYSNDTNSKIEVSKVQSAGSVTYVYNIAENNVELDSVIVIDISSLALILLFAVIVFCFLVAC